jgi:GAF domain-containing protein
MRRKCASFECWAERVVRSCRKLLDASGACISVVDDTGKLVNVVFSGSTGGPGAARSRLSASARRVRTRAYLSGEVAYENDTPSRKKGRSQHRGAGVTGRALFAPMITDGVVHGMLGVFGKRAGFDDYDARVASAFAEIAGLALQSHRTLLALRRGEEAFRGIARRDASFARSTPRSGRG